MNDLIGLDADTTTALTVITTGVLIPVVTSLLKQPQLPAWARRAIPIALAAVAAAVIILLQAGGPFAEQLVTWLVLLATLVGIAQGLYAVMPSAWKSLEQATSTNTHRAERSDAE